MDKNENKDMALLIFKDEDNLIKEIFVEIISKDNNFLTYKTRDGSMISIPIINVVKIKRKNKEV